MISLHLARWLRNAGLVWDPVEGDEFVMPDHDLDTTFRIADMVVEVRRVPAGRMIALNGTPEWAMDAIDAYAKALLAVLEANVHDTTAINGDQR